MANMLRLKILLAFIVVVVVSLLIVWIVFKYKRGTDNQLNRIMHITTMNSSEMLTEDMTPSEMVSEDLKPSEMVTSTPNEDNTTMTPESILSIWGKRINEINTKIVIVKDDLLEFEKLITPVLKRQNGNTEHPKMSRQRMATDGSVRLQDNEPPTD